MNILNEIYFGENIITDRIINIIEECKQTEKTDKARCKELIYELNDALRDFSGAKVVEIDVEDDTYGYTISPPYKRRPKYNITKNGIRFVDNNSVVIIISLGSKLLFKNKEVKLTSREICAILLHEIGHNFSKNVIPMNSLIETMAFALRIKNEVRMNAATNKKISIDKTQIDKFIKSIFLYIKYGLVDFGKSVMSFLQTLHIINSHALSELYPFKFGTQYIDEQFADSFASMYGFGKDLSSGLHKLETTNFKIRNKEYSMFSLLVGMMSFSLTSLFDEHPDNISRMTNQIDYLEYELKHNVALSKEDKKDMQKQIIQIKALIKQSTIIDSNNKYSIPYKVYSKILVNLLGGQEIFGKINKALFNAKIMDHGLLLNKKK